MKSFLIVLSSLLLLASVHADEEPEVKSRGIPGFNWFDFDGAIKGFLNKDNKDEVTEGETKKPGFKAVFDNLKKSLMAGNAEDNKLVALSCKLNGLWGNDIYGKAIRQFRAFVKSLNDAVTNILLNGAGFFSAVGRQSFVDKLVTTQSISDKMVQANSKLQQLGQVTPEQCGLTPEQMEAIEAEATPESFGAELKAKILKKTARTRKYLTDLACRLEAFWGRSSYITVLNKMTDTITRVSEFLTFVVDKHGKTITTFTGPANYMKAATAKVLTTKLSEAMVVLVEMKKRNREKCNFPPSVMDRYNQDDLLKVWNDEIFSGDNSKFQQGKEKMFAVACKLEARLGNQGYMRLLEDSTGLVDKINSRLTFLTDTGLTTMTDAVGATEASTAIDQAKEITGHLGWAGKKIAEIKKQNRARCNFSPDVLDAYSQDEFYEGFRNGVLGVARKIRPEPSSNMLESACKLRAKLGDEQYRDKMNSLIEATANVQSKVNMVLAKGGNILDKFMKPVADLSGKVSATSANMVMAGQTLQKLLDSTQKECQKISADAVKDVSEDDLIGTINEELVDE